MVTPTLQDLVSTLSPTRARLLVKSSSDSTRYRLSPPQFAVFTADQITPGTTAYLNPCAIRLVGPLNPTPIVAALGGLHYRNPALRSRYALDDAGPYAQVTTCDPPELELVDVSDAAHPTAEAMDEARWSVRPFPDLGKPPLWRAVLIREAPDRHLLVLVLHHLISDGWSWRILQDQLAALVEFDGDPRRVPRSEDYFATWLQSPRSESDAAPALAADVAPGLDEIRLVGSADGPGPGFALPFQLSPEECALVRAAARGTGGTSMTVLAWAVGEVLHELRGVPRSVALLPMAGRWDGRSEQAVGCYVNSLPLLLDAGAAGDPMVRLRLTAVRMQDLLTHQTVPLSEVLQQLGNRRAQIGHFMLVHNNAPAAAVTFGGLTATPVHLPLADVQRDLTFSVWARSGSVGGVLQMRSQLAKEYGAGRIVERLSAALRLLRS